jgi:hypothetical protein
LLFPLRKFFKLSRHERPAGSLPIRPITGRHLLSPASSARTVIGLPCGWLCRVSGGGTGLPCSVFSTRRVGFRLFPGSFCVRVFPYVRGTASRLPFGSGLSASLACHALTRFITGSLTLTLPSKPGPRSALMLADPDVASRFHPDSRRGTLSRQLHTPPLPATHVPIGYC